MYVIYTGRKTLSLVSWTLSRSLLFFIHASLKVPIFSADVTPAVLYELLTQVAQLISSGQVMLSLEILFWGGCWTHSLEGRTQWYLVLKRLNCSEN